MQDYFIFLLAEAKLQELREQQQQLSRLPVQPSWRQQIADVLYELAQRLEPHPKRPQQPT
ncbi:MAG: hypothetical protein AAF708_09750 [Deinococcota bacterium]